MAAYRILQTLFLFLLVLAHPAFCQDQGLNLNKQIRLKPGLLRLDSLLQSASRQTKVVFSFNPKKIDTHSYVNIRNEVMNLVSLLALLKDKNGLAVKLMENYIVITSVSPKVEEKIYPIKKVLEPPISTTLRLDKTRIHDPMAKRDELMGHGIETMNVPSNVDSLSRQLAKVVIDSIKTQSADEQRQSIMRLPVSLPPIDSSKRKFAGIEKIEKKDAKQKNEVSQKIKPVTDKLYIFVKSGLSIDESSFLGVTAQVGVSSFYGTVSANTDFSVSQIRYGVGVSMRPSKKLRLHILGNMGSMYKSFSIDTSTSVLPSPQRNSVTVKGMLARVGISVEFPIAQKWVVQVGPYFNFLQTTYFINTLRGNLSTIRVASDGDQAFYTMKPPYLIGNTYSATSDSNLKTWIGVQVSVLYRLNF
jgi:hypothetical protein